jgi:hypothetical protein
MAVEAGRQKGIGQTQKGINVQKGAEARKSYSAPALREYGSLQTLTAMKPPTKKAKKVV